jgi:hypothetical protein
MEQASLDVAKQVYASPLLRRWGLTHGFRAGGAPGSMAQDYRFQKKAVYKKGVSYFVLGIAVVTGAAFACGQTLRPILIAQAPNSVPSSGVSDNAAACSRCFAMVRRPGDRANDRTPRHHYPAVQDHPKSADRQKGNARHDAPRCCASAIGRPARDDRAHYDR